MNRRAEVEIVARTAAERIVSLLERVLVSQDPLRALHELGLLRAELDVFEREQVRRALESGASFAAVARALGITRQAAHRRYRDLTAGASPPAASADARAILQRARHEAARAGASTVDGAHVVLALAAGGQLALGVTVDAARAMIPTAPSGGPPPTTLGRRLSASLTRIGAPIGVDELLRAASEDPAAREILDRSGLNRRLRSASPAGTAGRQAN